ncbi:hypothetical protein ACJX0J_038280, partial [Zea mays]
LSTKNISIMKRLLHEFMRKQALHLQVYTEETGVQSSGLYLPRGLILIGYRAECSISIGGNLALQIGCKLLSVGLDIKKSLHERTRVHDTSPGALTTTVRADNVNAIACVAGDSG